MKLNRKIAFEIMLLWASKRISARRFCGISMFHPPQLKKALDGEEISEMTHKKIMRSLRVVKRKLGIEE